jgi:predicted Zn-dependent protease
VLTALKNQEEGEKKRAAAEGRAPRIYHGVFASHPSADKRLQEVVAEADQAKTGGTPRTGREEYLRQINGVVFGEGAHEGVRRGSNFYHRDLNLAVTFPSGWRLENTPTAVSAIAQDAMMQMMMEDLNQRATPREYMHARIKANAFSDERAIDGSTFPAYAATARLNTPYGPRNTRVMVLFQDKRAYILFGAAKDDAAFARLDAAFLATARSMHPLSESERKFTEGVRLHTIKAQAGDSFATLTKRSPLSDYAELTLRLINNRLDGEPKPGETIKVVE